MSILLFTAAFSLIHGGFVFFAGLVHISSGDLSSFFPGWLAVLSSVLGVAELVALLALFMELRAKVLFLQFMVFFGQSTITL